MSESDDWTTVAVKKSTHRTLRQQLRGGEPFDSLIEKMLAQYEPDEAATR